jgi:prevent-host-death family protein
MNATKTIGAKAAKSSLPSLLALVAKGQEVIITKYGKPIAKLVPMEKPAAMNKDIADRILAFRGRIKLAKGETIRELVNAGRKY